MNQFIAFLFFTRILFITCDISAENDVLVYTVASEETDGFIRYRTSARENAIRPEILGFGEPWQGSDMKYAGGGYKVNLLRKALQKHANDEEKIALFTDGYDVIFLDKLDKIVAKFKATGARVLFGSEASCWPDKTLAKTYPIVEKGNRFLNSGLFMGYIKDLLLILNYEKIENGDDDQLFFTKAYLDAALREATNFQLDHQSQIFQNLYGATQEIEVIEVFEKEALTSYKIKNVLYQTEPLILHGNGRAKINLNYLANYVGNAWNPIDGCVYCKDRLIKLDDRDKADWPTVFIAIFIEYNTPFLEEQLEKIVRQEYPKDKIHLFIHNAAKYHSDMVEKFISLHKADYVSIKEIKPEDGVTEWSARDLSLDQCASKKADFYLSVDSIAHLDNPHTLKLLIEQNRTVVAPMLTRPGKSWSNFWGALSTGGYYARSNDYMEIVHNERRGLWNVPYVANAYLVNATLLRKYDRSRINFVEGILDPDMAFCAHLRDLDVFIYVSNRVDFGHLTDPSTFDVSRVEPDMYQIFENEADWEERFIHPNYPENLNPDKVPAQPCTDVYLFPIVTRKFTRSLINMMENFGKWSSGSNDDSRLEGGYEAVPTRDIHMNQVGWERHWLEFLRKYVRPLQEHVFLGYVHDPPRSLMNFVVRYKPDEQPSLRPHHDSSTYTINVALNEHGEDYEGGGCRFIRYNCSVTKIQPGWMLLHPGRLTHYHEGLLVTKGVRYIMVSFVDP